MIRFASKDISGPQSRPDILAKGRCPLDPLCAFAHWDSASSHKKALKMNKQTRIKIIKIRVSEEEFLSLKQRQVGDSLAGWMRQICLNRPVEPTSKVTRIVHTADPELIRQVAKIGGNLNQLAYHANVQKHLLTRTQMLASLANIESQVNSLLDLSMVHQDDYQVL